MHPSLTSTRRHFLVSSAALLASTRCLALPYAANSSVAEIIHTYARENAFNGVILAGRGDKIIDLQCFGTANAEKNQPVAARTRFEAGSISKWIATIIILKLGEQGKLALDVPITQYLPDYRKDTGSQLTLAFLMSHSSGLPNQIIAAIQKDRTVAEHDLPLDEAIRLYASGDLQFKPGTQWDYSHSNWLVVKAIAERISGKPYPTLVSDTLLTPLHLKQSDLFQGLSIDVPDMAQSYATLTPVPEIKPSTMPAFFQMAGGFYSTVEDMLHLMHGLTTGEVLSSSTLETLLKVRMPEQHYALGGRVRTRLLNGLQQEVIWEDVSNRGFRMLAVRVRADGRTVILCNNTSCDQPKMGDVADSILAALGA